MRGNSLFTKVALTVAILIVSQLAWHVPLPLLDPEVLRQMPETFGHGWEVWSIGALGLTPFVSGFLLVELYSLLTPWGRRVRRSGFDGRRRLNKGAFGLSLLIGLAQAAAVTVSLENMVTSGGLALVPDPGFPFRLLAVATMLAALVAQFVLCNVITARGIGNGFCLLVLADIVLAVVVGWPSSTFARDKAGFYLFTCLVAGAIFARLLKTPGTYRVSVLTHETEQIEYPAFPQGVVPIGWAYKVLVIPIWLDAMLGSDGLLFLSQEARLVGLAVVAPVLCFASVHLFSSRKRVETNLPGALPEAEFEEMSKRRLHLTTAALVVSAVAFAVLEIYLLSEYRLPGFLSLAMTVAIGVDLFDEWRFRQRNVAVAELCELDNVHLGLFVEAGLRHRDIDCLVKARHFRGLFFFLRPLYKMNVLVPADRLDEAREWIEEIHPRIV
ncbi:MAG: hypothetical protein GY719_31785 [bacterium]|nr:hypothetical protein [bacterium]